MDLQKIVFQMRGNDSAYVYIVCEGKKYGLIVMPGGEKDVPVSLSEDELRSVGGTYLSCLQWDAIRENLYFDQDNVSKEKNMTCSYYVLKDGLWGILDEGGRIVQEPLYEEVIIVNRQNDWEYEMPGNNSTFDYDWNAICGRVIVRRKGKWGMLRDQGQIILPTIHDLIRIVGSYHAASNVYIVCKDGRYGVVDQSGRFLIPMIYPSLQCKSLDFLWNCTVFRIDSSSGIGYVRLADGKCLVYPEWERVEVERRYLPPDNEEWGSIFYVWKENHCGVIFDDKGMIIPPIWDDIIAQRVQWCDPLGYSVRRGKYWGCYDAQGRLVCDAVWDEVKICINGITCVRKDGRWGAIDLDGQLCVPIEWDEIEGFGDMTGRPSNVDVLSGLYKSERKLLPESLSWVRRNGLWGLIDRRGTVIADPVWEMHDGTTAWIFKPRQMELQVCNNEVNDEFGTIQEFSDAQKIPDTTDAGYCVRVRLVNK